MRKNLLAAIAAVVLSGFTSCGQRGKSTEEQPLNCIDTVHNSCNSIDWQGIYTGITPCADCEGIKTILTLSGNTYVLEMAYLGKSKELAHRETGIFSWDECGSVITLSDSTCKISLQYRVGENQLTQLDCKGKVIDGDYAEMYILKKVGK
ncbi:MAG: copper resistance protein NlpE [Prevotellaceae bacterium]|jgi:uncharacterized lipoprotein NlpE involved in copper resistance|nr:copper resistance protein NlpE [Prevotellaceae bacterium]